MRQPVGPCLLITPWNFPLAMGTRKIGPAIAAGCTMVVKPAKQTPLSMLALAQIFEEAGLPAGVLNVVTTSHAGQVTDPLFDDPRLRKLSFTGSTEVGRTLCKARDGRHAARLDGARRQRAASGLRRRRSRARGRPGDDGEASQHGRGLHVREPHVRSVRRGRGVLAPDGGADGAAAPRPRRRPRHRRRSADRRDAARQGPRARAPTRWSAARPC